MAETSAIEWTHATFNPWIGCTKISAACDHCYAETLSKARLGVPWGAGQPRRRTSVQNWNLPLRWDRKAAKEGRRMRVFCASLADVFDAEVSDEWRNDLFMLIDRTPHLDWLLLTKRPAVARKVMPAEPRPNVWLGTTVEDQKMAEARIPHLLATPAAVRFLSMEPLLGPVDLRPWLQGVPTDADMTAFRRVDWVIAGGESGHGARPSHPDWFRAIRDECVATGVPFLFKQWGEWRPISEGEGDWYDPLYRPVRLAKDGEDQDAINESYGRRCAVPEVIFHNDGSAHDLTDFDAFAAGRGAMHTFRVGKKAAGRHLDGVLHDGYPA